VAILATFSIIGLRGTALSDYQLTTYPGTDTWPSWSPDGAKIAYFAFSGSWYRHIWVMNNDGSNQVQLTSGNVVDQYQAFSPDGAKIAFTRWGFRGDTTDIMIMDADGSNIQRITFSGIPGLIEGCYHEPQWSRDGNRLIFTYWEGTTAGIIRSWIATMNVDGTNLQVIGRGESPKFCCNDEKILFTTDHLLDGQARIALMSADGTDVHILTDGPEDVYADMSSVTHRIIFVRNQDLYIMNEDGSNLKPITSDGLNYYPRWSPDEKWIAYTSKKLDNWDIWKMEAPTRAIEASIDIDPNTLNLKSNGEWITAYIELSEGYLPNQIDISSILLNGEIQVYPEAPTQAGDYDSDGVPDLMVKFDRSDVITLLGASDFSLDTGKSCEVQFTITGTVADTMFQGTDIVRVLLKG
jgi:Tol biopolymer transport system component